MTESRLALVAGLFIVPALLLWLGHRLRKQTPVWRRVFWGATLGYVAGMLLMLVAIHYPPVLWAGGGWRTAAVHWGMVVGAVVGAEVGWIAGRGKAHSGKRGGDKTSRLVEAHEQAIADHHDVFRDLAK